MGGVKAVPDSVNSYTGVVVVKERATGNVVLVRTGTVMCRSLVLSVLPETLKVQYGAGYLNNLDIYFIWKDSFSSLPVNDNNLENLITSYSRKIINVHSVVSSCNSGSIGENGNIPTDRNLVLLELDAEKPVDPIGNILFPKLGTLSFHATLNNDDYKAFGNNFKDGGFENLSNGPINGAPIKFKSFNGGGQCPYGIFKSSIAEQNNPKSLGKFEFLGTEQLTEIDEGGPVTTKDLHNPSNRRIAGIMIWDPTYGDRKDGARVIQLSEYEKNLDYYVQNLCYQPSNQEIQDGSTGDVIVKKVGVFKDNVTISMVDKNPIFIKNQEGYVANDDKILCGTTCRANGLKLGSLVELVIKPEGLLGQQYFTGFTGQIMGRFGLEPGGCLGNECRFSVRNTATTINVDLSGFKVTVQKTGNGEVRSYFVDDNWQLSTGPIHVSSGAITKYFPFSGKKLLLHAIPNAGNKLDHWDTCDQPGIAQAIGDFCLIKLDKKDGIAKPVSTIARFQAGEATPQPGGMRLSTFKLKIKKIIVPEPDGVPLPPSNITFLGEEVADEKIFNLPWFLTLGNSSNCIFPGYRCPTLNDFFDTLKVTLPQLPANSSKQVSSVFRADRIIKRQSTISLGDFNREDGMHLLEVMIGSEVGSLALQVNTSDGIESDKIFCKTIRDETISNEQNILNSNAFTVNGNENKTLFFSNLENKRIICQSNASCNGKRVTWGGACIIKNEGHTCEVPFSPNLFETNVVTAKFESAERFFNPLFVYKTLDQCSFYSAEHPINNICNGLVCSCLKPTFEKINLFTDQRGQGPSPLFWTGDLQELLNRSEDLRTLYSPKAFVQLAANKSLVVPVCRDNSRATRILVNGDGTGDFFTTTRDFRVEQIPIPEYPRQYLIIGKLDIDTRIPDLETDGLRPWSSQYSIRVEPANDVRKIEWTGCSRTENENRECIMEGGQPQKSSIVNVTLSKDGPGFSPNLPKYRKVKFIVSDNENAGLKLTASYNPIANDAVFGECNNYGSVNGIKECEHYFPIGTRLTLNKSIDPARADISSSWVQGCSGNSDQCVYTVKDSNVIKVQTLKNGKKILKVTLADPSGECNILTNVESKFSKVQNYGAEGGWFHYIGLSLNQAAKFTGSGGTFTWISGCDRVVNGVCEYRMTANSTTNIEAQCVPTPMPDRNLNLDKPGPRGRIQSVPDNQLNCSFDTSNLSLCSRSYSNGSQITLSASRDDSLLPNTVFDRWTGDCAFSGSSPTCSLTMNANKRAGITMINNGNYRLNVAIHNAGSCSIASNIGSLTCAGISGSNQNCYVDVPRNSVVNLRALVGNTNQWVGGTNCIGSNCNILVGSDGQQAEVTCANPVTTTTLAPTTTTTSTTTITTTSTTTSTTTTTSTSTTTTTLPRNGTVSFEVYNADSCPGITVNGQPLNLVQNSVVGTRWNATLTNVAGNQAMNINVPNGSGSVQRWTRPVACNSNSNINVCQFTPNFSVYTYDSVGFTCVASATTTTTSSTTTTTSTLPPYALTVTGTVNQGLQQIPVVASISASGCSGCSASTSTCASCNVTRNASVNMQVYHQNNSTGHFRVKQIKVNGSNFNCSSLVPDAGVNCPLGAMTGIKNVEVFYDRLYSLTVNVNSSCNSNVYYTYYTTGMSQPEGGNSTPMMFTAGSNIDLVAINGGVFMTTGVNWTVGGVSQDNDYRYNFVLDNNKVVDLVNTSCPGNGGGGGGTGNSCHFDLVLGSGVGSVNVIGNNVQSYDADGNLHTPAFVCSTGTQCSYLVGSGSFSLIGNPSGIAFGSPCSGQGSTCNLSCSGQSFPPISVDFQVDQGGIPNS